MEPVYVGIDVCKEALDVVIHPCGEHRRFSNELSGFRKMWRWLAIHDLVQIIVEASGTLHRAVCRYVHQQGVAVTIANPYRTRQFAQSLGLLAKTDKVDARMLAMFGAYLKPTPSRIASAQQERLQNLLTLRGQISTQIASVKTMDKAHTEPMAKALMHAQCELLQAQRERVDAELLAIIEAEPALQQKYAIVRSIKGIGHVNAVLMVAHMPELGQCNEKEIAALIGVAPYNRDSGSMRGKRMIKGGRKHVRNGLYMAAVSAARHNADMRQFYDRLIAKGKSHKTALTAVMRKLAILANALVKQNRHWNENYACA